MNEFFAQNGVNNSTVAALPQTQAGTSTSYENTNNNNMNALSKNEQAHSSTAEVMTQLNNAELRKLQRLLKTLPS